ncbi:hypothetical protein HRbin01_00599 [archaeon HR01]|nr:hypothetical protein HRbin01_00599 [archaeon HR01]
MRENGRAFKSYNSELDRKVGPISTPALFLIEGPNDSGKSVVSMQYCYGALKDGFSCYFVTTETSFRGLRESMKNLSWDVTHFINMGQLKIAEMHVKNTMWSSSDSKRILGLIGSFIEKRNDTELFVIDSMTYLLTNTTPNNILNFFTHLRNIVDRYEKTVILTIHTHAIEQDMFLRLRSISDIHFILSIKEMGDRIVRILQVLKQKGAEKSGLMIAFEIDQVFGIRVLPFSQAKA